MELNNKYSIVTLIGLLFFLITSGVQATSLFNLHPKNSTQILRFRGHDPVTDVSVHFTVQRGKTIIPSVTSQMIVDHLTISNQKGCNISDNYNLNGIVNVESVNFQPFSWDGVYGKLTGLFNINGDSYIKWPQLKIAKCSIPAENIIISPV